MELYRLATVFEEKLSGPTFSEFKTGMLHVFHWPKIVKSVLHEYKNSFLFPVKSNTTSRHLVESLEYYI